MKLVPAAWNRTCDLSLTGALLYLLSYAGETWWTRPELNR